jgi:hypothetical protein
MKKQTIFVLGFIFIFSGFVFAQTKTVTNADLEKFRQKRLKAEKDYRENYAEMGFPSPEELERQNAESRRRLNEFADQLREERITRENLTDKYVYFQTEENVDNSGYVYPNSGFIDYRGYNGIGYNNYYYRNRRHLQSNRRYVKRYQTKDYRQRFINSLPSYVLQNHRFNQINTNRSQRNSGTRIGIRIGGRN